ncbi:MAG: hypothetical protein FJ294_09870 [Planctomycetes bacterium]|nr:hypothetical protein [Planctomycetota bacterium]
MDFSLNSEPVKYALIALTVPLWWPFVRELWRELNDSLRDEGGILGQQLSPTELEHMNKARDRREPALVSEKWDEHERGNALESKGSRRGARASAPSPARPQRHGFR